MVCKAAVCIVVACLCASPLLRHLALVFKRDGSTTALFSQLKHSFGTVKAHRRLYRFSVSKSNQRVGLVSKID